MEALLLGIIGIIVLAINQSGKSKSTTQNYLEKNDDAYMRALKKEFMPRVYGSTLTPEEKAAKEKYDKMLTK